MKEKTKAKSMKMASKRKGTKGKEKGKNKKRIMTIAGVKDKRQRTKPRTTENSECEDAARTESRCRGKTYKIKIMHLCVS